jgi:hypothetical protein
VLDKPEFPDADFLTHVKKAMRYKVNMNRVGK